MYTITDFMTPGKHVSDLVNGNTVGESYLEPDDDDIELYDPKPQDAVKTSSIKCDKPTVTNHYETDDLDYYKENYIKYFSFVNTAEFRQMKAAITENTKVCYNVDVKDVNNTVMGSFTCPLEFEHDDLKSCCGHHCAQFCCSPKQYTSETQTLNTVAFCVILVVAAGLGLLFYFVLGSFF